MILLDEPTEKVCAAISSGTPVRLAMVAPGGYGKTAVLERLAGANARLVDDAHLLGDAELAELARLLDDGASVVIAARPYPRPAALNQVLARLRGQLVLRPFDRARTADFLRRTGKDLSPDSVQAETGGVPGFVRMLAEGGDLTGFRRELDLLPEDVLRFLLTLDARADFPVETRETARAAGFLGADGTVLPIVARALRELMPDRAVGPRWAEAAARAGDFDAALRLADQMIVAEHAPDRAEGARIAGTALAHRGQLARSAELFRWSDTGPSACFAAIGMVGTGRPAEAEKLLEQSTMDGPPTLLSGAVSSAAQGVLESLGGQPAVALSTLVRSAEMLEPVSAGMLLPDSPAALGALVALNCGEAAIAEPLLERAIESGSLVARHTLLLAWTAMLRGDREVAAARLQSAGDGLAQRDWLFAVGLRVGLARRAADLAGLRRIWGQAREAVIRQPVDLFTFLPFGEFEVAAARLGERDRLAPHLRQARELLAALGDPPLWATALHWSGLHAAILAEQPEEAAEHASALCAGAGAGPYFAVMAEAARCWLKVLRGDVDPIAVESAARGLHGAGLCWDGARLAGQAAIRTADRKAMVTLLDCARVLQGREPDPSEAPARLSERERQVAELVLAGLTYKQVGDQLFISAKTVEHHMARMRQRLGASSRSELLSELRAELAPATKGMS
ncbi:LuxR family transcriptional regulator [Amycolatopsis taiwanensis]|uniref:Helix-turn-helix transcriptional regulator n=1 Tax=Amycolatopsis taiwanensis TaxID=342230 RepID=A0A9W6QW14_9PSEU|nr:LuxR family transcriptional regulator [Amycolatopsis taiwanensis]GLY63975.1 helix-turn-helix transcriptional regulator [Amycolatopsis taiwanensis]